jgi:hypothetical protein
VGRQPPSSWLPVIDIAMVLVPTILGASAFVLTLRKAQKHG